MKLLTVSPEKMKNKGFDKNDFTKRYIIEHILVSPAKMKTKELDLKYCFLAILNEASYSITREIEK